MDWDSEAMLPDVFHITEFIENGDIGMAKWKKLPTTEETTLGTMPTPAFPSGPPVYWPRKVTLSGLLVRPTPLILSGLSLVVLPFSENSCGEAGSDSEPAVEVGGQAAGPAVRGTQLRDSLHQPPQGSPIHPSVKQLTCPAPALVLNTSLDPFQALCPTPHANPTRQMLSFLHC